MNLQLSKSFQLSKGLNVFLSLILSLIGASVNCQAETKRITIDGSSTVYPISEAVAEEFGKSNPNTQVVVGISGTGGGFKKFCRGETDVQDASRPIQTSEMKTCKEAGITYYEIPVGYDAAVIAVNPKNDFLNEISVEDLKKIWEPSAQGKIMDWNQVNPKWPKAKIQLYGAGSDSGTFDYFTEAIVGKAKSSRGDYTASEDDNTLVTGIANDKFALGYLPLSYYEENKSKLKALAVLGGAKSPAKEKAVLPSRTTVENGTYYPLSRPIFIYLNSKSMERPEVSQFAQFYLEHALTLVPEVKYVPLPKKAYEMGLGNIKTKKLGTVFGGESQVGLKIEELLKREAVH